MDARGAVWEMGSQGPIGALIAKIKSVNLRGKSIIFGCVLGFSISIQGQGEAQLCLPDVCLKKEK